MLLGLKHNDCLAEYPHVVEALKRLPKDQLYEREFRISRAIQLSLQKTTLPKEEWTKFEEVCYSSICQFTSSLILSETTFQGHHLYP